METETPQRTNWRFRVPVKVWTKLEGADLSIFESKFKRVATSLEGDEQPADQAAGSDEVGRELRQQCGDQRVPAAAAGRIRGIAPRGSGGTGGAGLAAGRGHGARAAV